MKFLVDNCISPRISLWLSEAGYDSLHLRDIGKSGADDSKVIKLAVEEKRIIISADIDFSNMTYNKIVSFKSRGTINELSKYITGVLVFRRKIDNPDMQISFLNKNLKSIKEYLVGNHTIIVEDNRMRMFP